MSRRMMWAAPVVMAALALLMLGTTGCLGGKEGSGILIFSWPTTGSFWNMECVRIQVNGGSAATALLMENRPADSSPTTIPLVGVPTGTAIYTMTAYSGENGTGSIMGVGYGQVNISSSVPLPAYGGAQLDPAATTTIVNGDTGTIYVGDTFTLYPVVTNPDSTAQILPEYTFGWETGDSTLASVGSLNGEVTAEAATTGVTISAFANPGTLDASIQLVIVNHLPTVVLSASPPTTASGGTVTLTWTSNYATSVSSSTNFTASTVNGSATVYPTATTTYSITVLGPGGTASGSTTVTVQ